MPRDMDTVIREILDDGGDLLTDVWGLDTGADLYGAGLTSHAAVGVMLWLEEEFDVFFPEDGPWRTDLRTIDSIRAAVTRLRAEQPA